MEIAPSARKHSVGDEDMRHAATHGIRAIDQGSRILIIGPNRTGALLEIVITDGDLIIHAMPLRQKFYRYLR